MFQSVAMEFVEAKFGNLGGVLGVLLVGSASFDCVDRLSDIDLEVVATQKLYRKVSRSCEGFERFKDVEITWEWMTLE
jgi:predicted nucleotidyltransferase